MEIKKRILVFSDTHGQNKHAHKALLHYPDIKTIIFLGDGLRRFYDLQNEFSDRSFHYASGNNDFGCNEKANDLITVCEKKIVFTHGHHYHVKSGIHEAKIAARARNADVLLFGHTHIALKSFEDGLHILNPGAAAGINPTCGFIDIGSDVVINICKI